MIKNIEVNNFSAFENLSIDFSPKINVIIGENSSGKSQLLKLLYTATFVQQQILEEETPTKALVNQWLTEKLIRVFKPDDSKTGSLCNQNKSGEAATVQLIDSLDDVFGFEISSERASKATAIGNHKKGAHAGVYLPAKEVLSLLSGVANQSSDPASLEMLFDDTVLDLCRSLLIAPAAERLDELNNDPRLGSLLPQLTSAIGGQYHISDSQQCFVAGEYSEKSTRTSEGAQAKIYSDNTKLVFKKTGKSDLSIPMTAEGYRKIGVLQQLLSNGSIDSHNGTPIYWDEPESNLNPRLMKLLVTSLIELSRNGHQVIIATHDYVLLKWLDLLVDTKKGDHIAFHSLYRTEKGVIASQTCDAYKQLSNNSIANTYSDLYDMEIARSLGINK